MSALTALGSLAARTHSSKSMPGTRPPAIQHDPSRERLDIAGHDDGPATPYPIYLHGWVTRGFGRGSKDLGCPTANLPDSSIQGVPVETGVHFGYARVLGCGGHAEVYPMVMSIGWNPFYNNDTRTAVRLLVRGPLSAGGFR